MAERSGNRPATAAGSGRQAPKRGTGTESAERPLVRIFISSPRDVAEEREIARQLVDAELPKKPALRERLHVVSVTWDDCAARIPMLATQPPQSSVTDARPRPAECDIMIVILWARMGTPLPASFRKPGGEAYLSGTEWEYEDAVNSTREPPPDVLVYRRTDKPKLDIDDPDFDQKRAHYKQVEAFFACFRNADGSLKRGVNDYATPAEFKTLLGQHLEELLHRRLPALAVPPAPGPVTADVPPKYLAWLRQDLETIPLLGAKEGRAVTLDHVYVPALTQPSAAPSPGKGRGKKSTPSPPDGDRKLVPLLQRLDAESLYVPAPAGAGKSTFCKWAVLQSIAGAELAHPVPPPEDFAEPIPADLRRRLPVLVVLREFWRQMDCGAGERTWRRGDLERALAGAIDRSPPPGLSGALLQAHLANGSAFLVFDGLDEVPVAHRSDGITTYPRALLLSGLADALKDWRKAGNRVLLTSRPYGLDEAGLQSLGLLQASLEPLPPPLQELFVTRWFHTLGKPEQTQGLIATIDARGDLGPLVENPMLLTAICALYDSGGRLPEDRYDLYKSIVAGVLYSRYPGDARERDPVERRLEAVALGMHTGECAGAPRSAPVAEISWVETEQLLARFAQLTPVYESAEVEASARREELLRDSGLLVPRPNQRAAFYHLSFQEFLAAQRLMRPAGDVERLFRERSAVAEWRGTLVFLFAALIAVRDAQWGVSLLAGLLAGHDRAAVKANPAPAVFIAEALDLCLAKKYAVPDDLKKAFRGLALDAIDDEVELQSRQALGLCLGRVGDPRIRSLRDPEAYIEVPAGTYPYGEEGRPIEIAKPFRIGRYPVTNSQYAEFIAAGGYREEGRRWWSADGWKWLQVTDVTEPLFWRDRRWTGPNQPVVGVSSWEAEACCAWASGRLPSEQEWEAAARGPRGLRYPWGNDWKDGICNTHEAGLGVTSPVGLFPHARQVEFGIEDLVGNAWEWCESFYAKSGKSSEASRVVRGGSWLDFHVNARAAFRDWFLPFLRYYFLGFRVVCLSPILDH